MPRSFGPGLSPRANFGGQGLSSGIGRGAAFHRGRPDPGGVFPRKGKGWGIQGEAAFPDLLTYWDKVTQWQSWRRGMNLAFGASYGQTVAADGVEVLIRPAFKPDHGFVQREVVMLRFASSSSPVGSWAVTVKPRGFNTAPLPLLTMMQRHETRTHATTGGQLPVLVVDGGLGWQTTLEATSSLVGELVTDSCAGLGNLLQPEDGIALLCLQVDPGTGQMVFDASRYWRYEVNGRGARVLIEHSVGPGDSAPQFQVGRHLTQALTLSCNCPSHLGVEHARLRDVRIGTQDVFPQQGGQEIFPNKASHDMAEGVKRRFGQLEWARIPGHECKHCYAARFLLRAPLPEPSDMLSPASDYWQTGRGFDRLEGMPDVFDERRMMLEAERSMLLRNEWEEIDQTLLAASVGDALTVLPVRISHDPPIAEEQLPMADVMMRQCFRMAGNPPRFNEMHFSRRPEEDDDAIRGDWWVGRGTNTQVRTYDGVHHVLDEPAMRPLRRAATLSEVVV